MRRTLRMFLGGVALLALGAAVALCVLLWTDWGHARIAAIANAQVSDAIAGELRIGHIDEIDLPTLRARDVKILAPDGKAAIEVEQVAVDLDLRAILSGVFAWHRAEIRGGVVRVTEDARGKINMEETFRSSTKEDKPDKAHAGRPPKAAREEMLELRTMVTEDMTLFIAGKSLPELHLAGLYGIMRIDVPHEGPVVLRFDEYRGSILKGLPTGRLDFRDVKGEVKTESARLLRFEGRGRSEGEPVSFELDIATKPETKVQIDATFPEVSPESVSTMAVDAWSKAKDGIDLTVHHRKGGG